MCEHDTALVLSLVGLIPTHHLQAMPFVEPDSHAVDERPRTSAAHSMS
jgi:hypothetical protein